MSTNQARVHIRLSAPRNKVPKWITLCRLRKCQGRTVLSCKQLAKRSRTKRGEIDYESVVKLAEGFNGADLRNICTEAGLFAIRDDRDYILEEDFMKAARKIAEVKKLESKLDYSKV